MVVLRPYQSNAVDATFKAWDAGHHDCLVYSPTGTGKTVMFIEIIRMVVGTAKRVMVIVDREELVSQTVQRIVQTLNIYPCIEQADQYAVINSNGRSPVVVATIQSLRTQYQSGEYRYERFDPRTFQCILLDEAHLTITSTYFQVIKHFKQNPDLVLAGFTATPKRADGRSLAQMYPHCSFEYRMLDAINDGYLVPVRGKVITVSSVSLKGLKVSSKSKDYTDKQIGELMEQEKTLFETVGALLKETVGKQTIVFTPRVNHAKLMAAAINQERPDTARVIYGAMNKERRKRIINDFKEGRIQYLCNCAVLTTGFDAPNIEVVANCRPTKSWSLFTQIVGRGTRPLPGVVDGDKTRDERIAAIAASSKPHLTVLSFVGREGSMNLVGPEDVLAGEMEPPEVVERAKEILDQLDQDDDATDIMEAIEQAREQIETEQDQEAAIASVRIDGVEYEIQGTDWFDKNANFTKVLKSQTQLPEQYTVPFLEAAGYPSHEITRWDQERRERASKYLQQREATGMCTLKQSNLIKRLYPNMSQADRKGLTKREAASLIGRGFENKKKKKVSA